MPVANFLLMGDEVLSNFMKMTITASLKMNRIPLLSKCIEDPVQTIINGILNKIFNICY